MHISSCFQGGSIEIANINIKKGEIDLKLQKDTKADFSQWFYFRLQGAKDQAVTIRIINAGESTYHKAWANYQTCYSYDRELWSRNEATTYDGKVLTIKITPEFNDIYFAYFAPYSWERHLDLINDCQFSSRMQVAHLGQSSLGLDMNMIQVGNVSPQKQKIWIIARQHPSETMGEWFMEGLIERLLNEEDSTVTALLEQATLYLVPNMNPDGTILGHTRTNGKGFDLNRQWQAANPNESPEVYHVKEKMLETGVDLFFDIHGDEAIPYLFVAGCEGNPHYDKKHQAAEERFKQLFAKLVPEFQDEQGYDKDTSGQANLALAANYIGETYRCLSYTVEMPFKDTDNIPHPGFGWSPERARILGANFVTLLWQYLTPEL